MEVVSHLIRERKGFNYENITHPRSDGARQVHVMPTQGCCTEDCHAQLEVSLGDLQEPSLV